MMSGSWVTGEFPVLSSSGCRGGGVASPSSLCRVDVRFNEGPGSTLTAYFSGSTDVSGLSE